MISRRQLLKTLGSLPLGGLLGGGLLGKELSRTADKSEYRDLFKELGLRTFINAQGTWTYLTGSLMHPKAVEAINQASLDYVNLNELQDAVGRRLADICKSESAMVTSGAFGAMTLGTAACITGTDEEKIRLLPNLPGPQLEVIIQNSHRFGYDHAVRNTGIRFVEVETAQELRDAVNGNTVMMLFLNAANNRGQIQDREFVRLGKELGVPTLNDSAADVPPVERLWMYNEMDFDMVCFSGGKGLRGPQSTGLLCGREDLIEAAKLNTSPNGDTIGRGMKVNKEEMVGLLVAVEEFVNTDHEEQYGEFYQRVQHVGNHAADVPGVSVEIVTPPIANHTPTLVVTWDENRILASPSDIRQALRDGHPSIEVNTTSDSLRIALWMARAGQEKTVARRLKEELEKALV